ncbi:MAG: DNA polymerase III subunit gamma/tau [Myxococcales bacterium]|nr:DNA polymerase III subunit gamma/tau [Myxococcales bacterium]
MSYVVLARKYRPADLGALIGQEHIGRALTNAIAMDRVAHAFLFCGARGTGKTSTARILAKMLNCADGPTATPCGTCAPCKEISTSTCIDVHELDAASNRGIGEIRELREGVGYAPARDRHKVYIIDEAHMLTTEAANAFLKTLEEPPPHVIFVLATTDPQRLPVTIRSRCQRYDFRRIRSGEVVKSLAKICESEGVNIDAEALFLVAREGDGSMRDSLSVLDQVIAFGGADMAADEVAALLGVADRNRTATLMQALLSRDAPAALRSVGAAHTHGMDLRTFGKTLAMEARDLLMIRLAGSAARDLVDRAESEVEALAKMAQGIDTNELERLAHVLLELAETVARARHPRLVMELGVVRLCRAAALRDVAELAGRVETLLHSRAALPPRQARQPHPQTTNRPQSSAPVGRPASPGGSRLRPRQPAGRPSSPVSRGGGDDDGAGPASPRAHRSNQGAPTARSTANSSHERARVTGAPAAAEFAPPTPAMDGPRGRSLHDSDLARWHQTLERTDKRAAGVLKHAVIQSSGPGRIALAFGNTFMKRQAATPEIRDALTRGASEAFGGRYVVESAEVDERAQTESLAAKGNLSAAELRAQREAALEQDPDVQRVVSVFSGTVFNTIADKADGEPEHRP